MKSEKLSIGAYTSYRGLCYRLLKFQHFPNEIMENDFVTTFKLLTKVRTEFADQLKPLPPEEQKKIYTDALAGLFEAWGHEEKLEKLEKKAMPAAFSISSILNDKKSSKFSQYVIKYVTTDIVANFSARIKAICADVNNRMAMISAMCNYYEIIGQDIDTARMETLLDQAASSIYQLDIYCKDKITVYYPSPIKSLLTKKKVWHLATVTYEEAESDVNDTWVEITKEK